jgi:hypothetical protein
MTNREIRRYQMLVRVREFGAAHQHLFPARSVAGKLFAAVAAAAEALQRHDSKELAGRDGEQDGAASKAPAREALRRQIRAITQTAAASEVPGLHGKFRAAPDRNDERLLSQARTFLSEAKPFKETFVAHELPADFLSRLRAAIEAFEAAMHDRASGRDQRLGARARFEAAMEDGLSAVRRLSAIVPNKLQDPAEVTLWSAARHLEEGRVRNNAATAPDGTPQSPSPTPPDDAKTAA